MKNYDAIIIGSGQAGTPLSKKLANEGWKTVLIEKDLIGGTCTNVGCTPTKTMIASAKRMYDCKNARHLGVHTGDISLNINEVIIRKNKIVESFRNGAKKGLEKTENLEIIFGTAVFTGKKTIKVTDKSGKEEALTANKIFIDVGARPSVPQIKGLQNVSYLTSTTIMELPEVPEHLLIIGGGYIGLEFGQMYRRFGSKVTILEESNRFMGREDSDIAQCILEILQAEDIQILRDVQVNNIEKEKERIKIGVKMSDKEKTIICSHILLAIGRKPNTDLLKTDVGGVNTDEHGFIEVNDELETSVEGVFALGDVKGGPEFTHIAYNDYLVVYNNLIKGKKENYHNRLVPYTMFTDPQLGRVGITEDEAKKKGLKILVATLPMKHVARAIETGDTRGMMKAIVDAESGAILGVAIVGEQGGEVMTVLQMAMVGGVTWQQIRSLPIAHPLFSESLNNLFMQLDKK